MSTNKINFWLNVVLGALLVVAMTALLPGEMDRSAPGVQNWNLLHEICGTLILAISTLHLALHWGWIKAVVLRRAPHPVKAVRRNRTTDLWLFVLAIPCAIAGLMVWTLPGILPAPLGLALSEWRDLHNWTGSAMFVTLVIHLSLHWKWITFNVRRWLLPGARPRAKGAQPEIA